MYDFKEFYQQNRDFVIAFIVVAIICVCGIWFYHDKHRNDDQYHDTNQSMADLEKRINRIESRVNSLQSRLAESEKTVNGIAERIDRSRENAEIVAGGLGEAEKRIDSAIQRSGRITNLIEEIERANRPGTQNPQKTDMAK